MSEPIKNIVLVGRTGNGKSSTGNALIGGNEKMFIARKSSKGVTKECTEYRVAIQDGPILNIIDTPGLFDSDYVFEDLSKEIIKCLSMAKEGIHAVLFVLSTKNRISQEEESTLNTLQRIFDSKILDYFIVVFTGGDELEEDGRTLDDYFSDGYPHFLMRVLRLCGGRKVLFDNKTTEKEKKAQQIKELLAHVADVEKQTGGVPYSENMYIKIKEEEEKLREQEREIESTKVAEAELQEKLRMEIERKKIADAEELQEKLRLEIESIKVVEAELHEKLRSEIESNKLAEAELQEKLRMEIELKKVAEAELQEKVRMEIESKKIAAAEDLQEKLRMEIESKKVVEARLQEKLQMEIESKKLAEAKVAVMEEKLLFEREKNMQEESNRIKEQEKNARLAVMEEELRLEREKNIQVESDRLKEHERNAEPKKTHMIYARDLCIEWSHESKYWTWIPLQYEKSSGSFVEAAKLIGVCWLHVTGSFDTKELTQYTHYEVVFLVKLIKSATGWKVPVKLTLNLPSGKTPQERIVSLEEHIGKSWVAIPIGEFMTKPENAGCIKFEMFEKDRWQEGLVIKGVAIRPKD